jgi:hemerythrin-like domain-containing protein
MAGISRRDLLLPAAAVALAGDAAAKATDEQEVTATEDLMREHGVIRRALLVYHHAAEKLRPSSNGGAGIDPAVLNRTAKLFRTFGEDYHERMLEEKHIFPIVKKMGGRAGAYPDILVAQHNRGREITEYMLAVTGKGAIGSRAAEMARAMSGLVLMYQHHAAREDTIVFPAWKKNFTNKQLDELGDQFEEIEHKMFGHDGFEDAERTVSEVERALGMEDLAQFTPPAPGLVGQLVKLRPIVESALAE